MPRPHQRCCWAFRVKLARSLLPAHFPRSHGKSAHHPPLPSFSACVSVPPWTSASQEHRRHPLVSVCPPPSHSAAGPGWRVSSYCWWKEGVTNAESVKRWWNPASIIRTNWKKERTPGPMLWRLSHERWEVNILVDVFQLWVGHTLGERAGWLRSLLSSADHSCVTWYFSKLSEKTRRTPCCFCASKGSAPLRHSCLLNVTCFSSHHLEALIPESQVQPPFVLISANTKVVTFRQWGFTDIADSSRGWHAGASLSPDPQGLCPWTFPDPGIRQGQCGPELGQHQKAWGSGASVLALRGSLPGDEQ